MAGIQINGADQKLVLDSDADTYLEAATDDIIKVYVSGAEDLRIGANAINVLYFNDANVPIYQNINAEPARDASTIKKNLILQLENPVQWFQTINNMVYLIQISIRDSTKIHKVEGQCFFL